MTIATALREARELLLLPATTRQPRVSFNAKGVLTAKDAYGHVVSVTLSREEAKALCGRLVLYGRGVASEDAQ